MASSKLQVSNNNYTIRLRISYLLLSCLVLIALCKSSANFTRTQILAFVSTLVINQLINGFNVVEEIPYLLSFSFIFQELFPDRFIYYIRDDNNMNGNIVFLILKFITFYGLQLIVGSSLTKLEIEFFSISIINLLFTSKLDDLPMVLFRNLLITYILTILLVVSPSYLFSIALPYIYSIFTIIFLCIFTYLSYLQVGEFFITWFINYLKSDQSRLNIVSYWCIIFGIIVSTLYLINCKFNSSTEYLKLENSDLQLTYLNYRRKIWHFLIVLIMLPVLNDTRESASQFLKIVLTILIQLFLIIELARYLNVAPLGPQINSLFENFRDFRDLKGPIVISYLYLLIGISIPIFLDGSSMGLIALGLGDSMASIIGKQVSSFKAINIIVQILKLRWFDTKKTVAGTLAFVVSCFFTCTILKFVTRGELFSKDSVIAIFISCVTGGVFEAISDLNDNILIPCLMTMVIMILRC